MTPTRRVYGTYQWRQVRLAAIARDGGACVHCGSRAQPLEVDHITRPEDGGSVFDLANLRTLCGRCHRRRTARAVVARRKAERKTNPKPRRPRRVSREW